MSIEGRSQRYGKLFSHWQIREQIGQGSGGRAVVFKMVNAENQWEYCALKSICLIEERGSLDKLTEQARREYTEARANYSRQAEREVRLMSVLRGNTNIVDYLDHAFQDWADDTGFGRDLLIRMELLRDLRGELRADRVFDRREIIRLGLDICTALCLCQRKNILHRDIKPENIFINDTGSYKLGDFGISRIIAATPASTASTGIGTPEYAAPEQASGHYNRTVDIYSLGLVLYELSNGNRLPFASSRYVRQAEVLRRNMGDPLPPPCNADEALSNVILKACAFRSEDRYQSAEEFYDALKQLAGQAPVFVKRMPENAACTPAQEKPASAPEAPQSYAAAAENPPVHHRSGESIVRIKRWKFLPLCVSALCAALAAAVVVYGWFNCWFGHSWGEGTLAVPATHTSAGTVVYTCSACGETREEALAKLAAHTFDQKSADVKYLKSEATCTDPAVYYYSCECGEAGSETFAYGEALGHSWQDATVFAPKTCLNCGEQIGSATTAVSSGTCGENLEWALDEAGTLAIRGTGAMEDYEWDGAPWFEQRDTIKQIIIEDGVTSIGTQAFRTCSRLTSVSIPGSVTTIKCCAFYWDNRLKSAVIPDGVTTIEAFAFYRCESLAALTIPDSVTAIGDAAFGYCFRLTSATIPSGVISIGSNPFCGSTGIQQVSVAEGNANYTSVDGIVLSKDRSALICYPAGNFAAYYTIPDTVTCIGTAAFEGCGSLFTVTVPDSVASIGSYAFSGCTGLISITVPGSVSLIGSNAFDSCTSLEIVRCIGTEENRSNMCIESDGNDYLLDAIWQYVGQTDEAAQADSEPDDLFANGQALTGGSAEDFIAMLEDDSVSAIIIPANVDITVPSQVVIAKPVLVEGRLSSSGTLTVDGKSACVSVTGELDTASVLRTVNDGRIILEETGSLENANAIWLESSADLTNLGGVLPQDAQIAVCSEKELRSQSTEVPTAEAFIDAINTRSTKAIVITGNVTVDAEGAALVGVSVPLLIDEGASLTIVNTGNDSNCEDYLYMSASSCLINYGTLNASVNVENMQLLVNHGTWAGGIWDDCAILLNYGDMTLTHANNSGGGIYGDSSYWGGTLEESGHCFNEGTLSIEEDADTGNVIFARGIFVNCNSGTIVVNSVFSLKEGVTAYNHGTIRVESSTFYNFVLLTNDGTIEVEADGCFINSGVLLNQGCVTSAGNLDNSNSGLILTAADASFSAGNQPGGWINTVDALDGTALGSAWEVVYTSAELEAAMDDAAVEGITLWLTEDSVFTGDLTVKKPLIIRNNCLTVSGTLTIADGYAAAIEATMGAEEIVLEGDTFFYTDGSLEAGNITIEQNAVLYYASSHAGKGEAASSITVDGGILKFLSCLALKDANILLRGSGILQADAYLTFENCTIDIGTNSFLSLSAYLFDESTVIANSGHISLISSNWVDARMEGTLINNGAILADIMEVYGTLENNGRIYCRGDSAPFTISAKNGGEIQGSEIIFQADITNWWNG